MADPRDPHEIEDEDPDLIETDEGADAGQVDYEGGDDAETGSEPEVGQTQERVDRRSRRDDDLRAELRAQREHNARVEAELQQFRQAREQQQRPQEDSEEAFQARIALLDPEQRMDAKLDRATRRHNQQLALATFAAADRADKAAFDSRANTDPLYKKYAQEVENILAIERRKGRDFDRETILSFVVGNARRANAGKPSPARQQGQQRIQSQQARTTGGRGDQTRDQRPRRYAANDMSADAVRSRLEAPDAFI